MKNIFSIIKSNKKDEKIICPKCGKEVFEESLMICDNCGKYMRMGAVDRIASVADEGTFVETDGALQGANPIDFPGYDEKIKDAKEKSNLNEAVVCGKAEKARSACADAQQLLPRRSSGKGPQLHCGQLCRLDRPGTAKP